MIPGMLCRALRSSGHRAALVVAFALAGCGGGGATGTAVTAVAGVPAIPTPTPTPTPTPGTAVPVGIPVPTPSLAGLAAIASGLNVADFLVPSWGTGAIPEHDVDVGAFRFLCAPSHNAYNDPIVYPGQPGKSHLHTFFGNTLADANSTYASLRTTGESTCNDKLNRSAYWIPAMINGADKVVMPDYLAVYYKRMPSSDPRCSTFATACVQLPRGLRYIFGFNMGDPASTPITETSKYQRWWNCDTSTLGPAAMAANPGGHYGTIKEAMQAFGGCPVGARLGMVLVAPDCWNGKDLDSADHRSHMSYRVGNANGEAVCPSTHPYIIPQFQLGSWYTVDSTAANWYLASDRMPGMAPSEPGTTQHADWFGAWEDSILTLWHANCIEKLLSCTGGDLGNGTQIKTTAGYDYQSTTVLADIPPKP
jgi:hypothetical protein